LEKLVTKLFQQTYLLHPHKAYKTNLTKTLMELSNRNKGVYFSRLRKLFNRKEGNRLSLGELVKVAGKECGEFRGISTYHTPGKIVILAYENPNGNRDFARNLPTSFKYEGQEIPVVLSVLPRPPIVAPVDAPPRRWYER